MDRFGRLNALIESVPAHAEIRAESLIDAKPGLFPESAHGPIVLRDDRSESEPATRESSRHLAGMISAISSDAGLSESRTFARVGVPWEVFQLTLGATMALMTCGMTPFTRNIVFLLWAALAIAAQFLAAGLVQTWLPGLPCLAALTTSWIIGYNSTVPPATTPSPPAPEADPTENSSPSAPIGDTSPTVAAETPIPQSESTGPTISKPVAKAEKDKKSRRRKP